MKTIFTILSVLILSSAINAQAPFLEEKTNKLSVSTWMHQTPILNLNESSSEFSGNAPTQRLDSFVIVDVNGSTNTKSVYEYDAQGNAILVESFARNLTTQTLDKVTRYEFTHTSNNDLDELTLYFYNSNNQIDHGIKVSHSYNGNNQLIERQHYELDIATSQWNVMNKDIYSYGSNGKYLTNEFFDYANNQWEKTNKHFYTYNSNDQVSVIDEQIFSNGSYVQDELVEYYYDSNDRIVEILDKQIYGTVWESFAKTSYTYFTGNSGHSREFFWDDSYGGWELNDKLDVHIDTDSNITSRVFYQVNQGVPEFSSRNTYTHDNNFDYFDLMILELYEKSEWAHKILTRDRSTWNSVAGQWENENYGTYYWTDLITNNESILTNDPNISVYPNPAGDYLQFSLPEATNAATLELFNPIGQLVLQQQISNGEQIEVSDLPTGFYQGIIEIEGKHVARKVVIE